MKYILASIVIALLSTTLVFAQKTTKQVSVETVVPKVNVAIFDANGNLKVAGNTPFIAYLEADSIYLYRYRHKYCHNDSGYVSIDTSSKKLIIPVRPYMARIKWKVSPSEAKYTLLSAKNLKSVSEGPVNADTSVFFGSYKLILRQKGYRSYLRSLSIHSDTVITINRQLQYCPPRLIIAINGGLSSCSSIPIGATIGYGGVHGAYLRYLQTIGNRPDGRDFGNGSLVDIITNPYTDQRSEYMSCVVGYQYMTYYHIYLQVGAGFGRQCFNWRSTEDGKRHRYSPDTNQGIAMDLGVGYSMQKFFWGASMQALPFGGYGVKPVCASVQAGIIL